MNTTYEYRPGRFFALTFLVTWLCWIPAAALSRSGYGDVVLGSLMGLGLLGPLGGSLLMFVFWGDRGVWRDFASRLFSLRRLRLAWVPVLIFLMPLVMIVSIVLSLAAGQGIGQLGLTSDFDIMNGSPVLSLIIPVLAPALEEMGWGGYGIDSLRSRYTLFRTSLVFGVLWGVWHLPLFFIQGYYHHSLVEENILYALNFFVSVLPLTFITNWLYYRNNRSILGAIMFHVSTVLAAEMFLVTNQTKCVVTIVLIVLAGGLVWRERREFFGETARAASETAMFRPRSPMCPQSVLASIDRLRQ